MVSAGIWLGLLEEGSDELQAADHLKAAIRKADVPLFYYLFSQLADDNAFSDHFSQSQNSHRSENAFDALMASGDLLKQLLSGQIAVEKAKPVKKKAVTESDETKEVASPKKAAGAKGAKDEKAVKDTKEEKADSAKKPQKDSDKKRNCQLQLRLQKNQSPRKKRLPILLRSKRNPNRPRSKLLLTQACCLFATFASLSLFDC